MLVQRRWMTGCPGILTLGGQISAVGLPECWLMRKRAASRRTALHLSSNRHSSSSEIGGCVVPKQPRAVDTGNLHSRPSRSSVHALAPSRSYSESSKTRYPKEGTIHGPILAGVSSSRAADPGLLKPTLPWPRVSTPGQLSGCCRCSSPHPFRLLSSARENHLSLESVFVVAARSLFSGLFLSALTALPGRGLARFSFVWLFLAMAH